jgi:secreted trypsin-like serine protease
VFSAEKGGRHRRRVRIAVPAAAVALAVGVGAAFLMAPAQAAQPVPSPTTSPGVVAQTQAQLKENVKAAVEAGTTGAPAVSQSRYSASSTTSSSPATADPKIIGGTQTDITSAPWMAQLWYYDDKGTSTTTDDVGFFCGGVVVSPAKIITAAHCAKGYDWTDNGSIIVGTAQIPTTDSGGNLDLHGGTLDGTYRQWVNPTYNASTIDNDIAILTLAVPVSVKPLPVTASTDTASYAAGTQATIYGWGRTSSTSNDISDTLRSATLPVDSDSTCSGYFGADFVAGHMVCAGNPATGSDTGTIAACNGDSGGPMVVNGKLVGVVSWGVQDCVASGSYSVFTKVRTYTGQLNMRIDDANLNFDNKADLFTRNAATNTGYEYDSRGTSFATRQSLGDWSGVNTVLQTDLDRDDYDDFIIRASGGTMYWEHYVPSSSKWVDTQIASWGSRVSIIAPGDVTGDGNPDLLSGDSAGALYLYPGKGDGTFAARVTVNASGWTQYKAVVGHGDFNGDGFDDLIAMGKTGTVYLYKGTGSAAKPFAARVQVRTGWTYNKLVATGDLNNDGIADLMARDSSGVLWIYTGTGKASSSIWNTRVRVSAGWNQYNVFG